jgi:hypothetical protein
MIWYGTSPPSLFAELCGASAFFLANIGIDTLTISYPCPTKNEYNNSQYVVVFSNYTQCVYQSKQTSSWSTTARVVLFWFLCFLLLLLLVGVM